MASGAAATIRSYKGKNTMRRGAKPSTITTTSHSATSARGGTGPVTRDRVHPLLKGTAGS